MEAIFKPDMLDFMLRLRFDNSKAFMEANRDEYILKMRTPYYNLIEQLGPTMKSIDPNMEIRPSKALSRIFRDTRYSRDKSPYRDHHWVAFRREAEPRESSIMYWFEIRVESVSWGLGFWGENKPALDVLRRRMVAKPSEMEGLLPILKNRGFILDGESYKRLPVPDHLPQALHPWYIKKELYLVKTGIDPAWVFKPGFEKRLMDDYLALAPFYKLLRGLTEETEIDSKV